MTAGVASPPHCGHLTANLCSPRVRVQVAFGNAAMAPSAEHELCPPTFFSDGSSVVGGTEEIEAGDE